MNKYLFLILTVLTLLNSVSEAGGRRRGGKEGNGGDGFSALFTELGYRIHRELLMEKYEGQKIQGRDAIPLESFFAAIRSTKVISTEETLRDNQGDEQTAIYLNPLALRELKLKDGFTEEEIQVILQESPNGFILFNITRFQRELASGWGAAARTVFHEYGRSAKLDESNYQTTAINFDNTFFDNLLRQSNDTTKTTLAIFNDRLSRARSKLNLIEEEKRRVRAEMSEDGVALKMALAQNDKDIQQTQDAFSRYGNALSKMIGNMGIMPMPFPSQTAKTVKDFSAVVAQGIGLQGKMTRQQVTEMQMDFLISNMKQNHSYYAKLNTKREEIFLKSLEE